MFDVPNYTDDLLRVLVFCLTDTLANRVCVAEVLAGQDFVNHHDWLRSIVILIGEEAALLERYTHRSQIARLDPVYQGHIRLARTRRFGLAFHPEEKIVRSLQGNSPVGK